MSEDSEAERKGSSAGEPSQLETRATLAARLLVVKLTIWRLATWDLLSMRIGRARHSHLACMPQAGRAGSGSLPLNYI